MSTINIRLSERLKADFSAACKAREMAVSNVLRDLMTNYVRANKRQNGKPDEEQPVKPSKSIK